MPRSKKEDEFFVLLSQITDTLATAAEEYAEIFHDFPESIARIPRMKTHEVACDEQVGTVMTKLYTSFITPFDREDISALARALDDVMDYMETSAARLDLFNLQNARAEAIEMADLTHQAVLELKIMIDHLPNYRKDSTVMEKASAISLIEDNGDTVYRNALRNIFLEDTPSKESMAWMRILDRMEHCINAIDHCATVVRTVVMKSA